MASSPAFLLYLLPAAACLVDDESPSSSSSTRSLVRSFGRSVDRSVGPFFSFSRQTQTPIPAYYVTLLPRDTIFNPETRSNCEPLRCRTCVPPSMNASAPAPPRRAAAVPPSDTRKGIGRRTRRRNGSWDRAERLDSSPREVSLVSQPPTRAGEAYADCSFVRWFH